MEYGERNSKYFINLEKRNQKLTVITKLHSHTGQVLTKGIDILGEEKYFYQQLYSSSNPPNVDIGEFLDDDNANIILLEDDAKTVVKV